MKEDDFPFYLFTDSDNGSSCIENSSSEKKLEEDDQTHYDDHTHTDEEEDEHIYIHEEKIFNEEEIEVFDEDEDTNEDEQEYYDEELSQVIEDQEKEDDDDDDDDEEEDEWMYCDEYEQQKDGDNIRIHVDTDEDEYDSYEDEEEEEEEEKEEPEDEEEEPEKDEEEEDNEDKEEEKEGKIVLQHPKKRRRINYNIDRISNLSDDTILHIMSFLDMRDAVRTGSLSKRWQYLWAESSTLVFQNSDHDPGENFDFLDFVNYTLQLSSCLYVKRFVLDYVHLNCYAALVDRAIRSVTRRRAEDFCLRFYTEEENMYVLPQYLFTNSSFKVLDLSNCVLAPICDFRWRSLRRLSLEYIELSDELVSKILKGSPNLEFLKISSCVGVSLLDIRSKSLKDLVVSHEFLNHVDWSSETVLKISALYLKSLELEGNFYKRRCHLENVASLVKADLDLKCDNSRNYQENHNYLFHLLQKLEHVEELKLGPWCTQVLSTDSLHEFQCLVLKCKKLTLHTNFMNVDRNQVIESLLISSPCLETLKVDMSYQSFDQYNWRCYNKKFKEITVSSLLRLKTVQFINIIPGYEEFVVRLVKIILAKAKELENMVIKTGDSGYCEWSSCLASQRFIGLIRKILRYPRCSPKAVISI